MTGTFFERIAHMAAGKRTRWVTLAAWIILAVLLSAIWPNVNRMEQNNASNLEQSQPSVVAEKLAGQEFPGGKGIPALLVWSREGGLTDEDYGHLRELTAYFNKHPLESQEMVPPLEQVPVPALKRQASTDGSAIVFPFFFKNSADSDVMKSGVKVIREQAKAAFGYDPFAVKPGTDDKMSAQVSGPAGISIDAVELFSKADVSLLMTTVAIVLLLLLIIYRSPILALIPLVGVGFAYGVTSPILGKMAEQGWITVDSQAISIMTVLLFGAGTDYCLFLISHFRKLLQEENDKAKALVVSIKDVSGAIAMSGFTVVISLLVLLLAKYGAVHRFAVPFSLSILVMGLVSLTLVPALLSILGRTSFFPVIPRTPEMLEERAKRKGIAPAKRTPRKRSGWIGRTVTARPWLIFIVALLLLGGLAANVLRIQYTSDLLSSFPEDMPSRQGFSITADKFTPGELAPVKLMVDTQGKQVNLKDAFSGLSFVSKVSEPAAGQNNKDIMAIDIQFNMNPYSNEAIAHIPDIRNTAEKLLSDAQIASPGERVWISGQTATQYDTETTYNRDTRIIIPIVIGLIALLLLIYLRSLVAMVYLILTVVLSFFSALGLGWLVIHDMMGSAAIQGLIPLYAFVFLVALGEDYNIFMVSSIWQKRKSMPLKDAIREGVNETGGVITSAGLILAGTFAVLATLPIQVLVQFGIVTAIGVLLDTFIVRPFLVPAITMLLNNWAF